MEPQARFSGQTARSVVEQVLKKNPRAGISPFRIPNVVETPNNASFRSSWRDSLARVSEIRTSFGFRRSVFGF